MHLCPCHWDAQSLFCYITHAIYMKVMQEVIAPTPCFRGRITLYGYAWLPSRRICISCPFKSETRLACFKVTGFHRDSALAFFWFVKSQTWYLSDSFWCWRVYHICAYVLWLHVRGFALRVTSAKVGTCPSWARDSQSVSIGVVGSLRHLHGLREHIIVTMGWIVVLWASCMFPQTGWEIARKILHSNPSCSRMNTQVHAHEFFCIFTTDHLIYY